MKKKQHNALAERSPYSVAPVGIYLGHLSEGTRQMLLSYSEERAVGVRDLQQHHYLSIKHTPKTNNVM